MYLRGEFESRRLLRRPERTAKKAAVWPPCSNSQLGTLENLYVLSLPTLGPFDYVERDSLAFLQAAEAFRLNRRIVNEYVFSILTADKAVALRVIEPLNRSLFHSDTSSFDVDIAQFDRDVKRQGVR